VQAPPARDIVGDDLPQRHTGVAAGAYEEGVGTVAEGIGMTMAGDPPPAPAPYGGGKDGRAPPRRAAGAPRKTSERGELQKRCHHATMSSVLASSF